MFVGRVERRRAFDELGIRVRCTGVGSLSAVTEAGALSQHVSAVRPPVGGPSSIADGTRKRIRGHPSDRCRTPFIRACETVRMSIFAEFTLPSRMFVLEETFAALPDVVVEVERVVATEDVVTPYFWVAGVSDEEFESAAEADSSIQDFRQLDTYEEAMLYRARWTENIESVVYAYTQIDAVVLDATGQRDIWEMQMRFDDHAALRDFRSYCAEHEINFEVNRIYEASRSHTGGQYGLTEKQHEALVEACKAGYFRSPAEASLSEIAVDLGISQQALSQRLRHGQEALVTGALLTDAPDG